jgi:ADP-ribosylglycohydrolase
MLGTIVGDIVGSAYEFNNYKAKDFQPLFHPNAKFTDDTVCTIAIADALLNQKHPAHALKEWGCRYAENGGWGRSFFLWLASDDLTPYNSYGNGGAMRVSPVGLLAVSIEETDSLAKQVTSVTHNHPEGMKGAAAVALSIFLARKNHSVVVIRKEIASRFEYDFSRSVDELRIGHRHSERAQDTVPQAITCALEATDFEDAIRNAVSIGGDSDTIAAIAGGIAEARFGIPENIAAEAWRYLPLDMRTILTQLYGASKPPAI